MDLLFDGFALDNFSVVVVGAFNGLLIEVREIFITLCHINHSKILINAYLCKISPAASPMEPITYSHFEWNGRQKMANTHNSNGRFATFHFMALKMTKTHFDIALYKHIGANSHEVQIGSRYINHVRHTSQTHTIAYTKITSKNIEMANRRVIG